VFSQCFLQWFFRDFGIFSKIRHDFGHFLPQFCIVLNNHLDKTAETCVIVRLLSHTPITSFTFFPVVLYFFTSAPVRLRTPSDLPSDSAAFYKCNRMLHKSVNFVAKSPSQTDINVSHTEQGSLLFLYHI